MRGAVPFFGAENRGASFEAALRAAPQDEE
jgi:hypothetical protein